MPNNRSPEEKRLAGLIGRHTYLSRSGVTVGRTVPSLTGTDTKPARDTLWEMYLRAVDPEGVLTTEERAKRAIHARKADMARHALLTVKAARQERQQAEIVDELFGGAV